MIPAAVIMYFHIGLIALTEMYIKGYNQRMKNDIYTEEMFFAFERWSINGTV